MRTRYVMSTLLLFMLAISSKSYGHDKPELLEGPYLGQNPPGSTPKIFAPNGLSTEHRDGSPFFSPDMKELYFTRKNHKDGKWSLITFKSENNRWHESVIGPRVGRPIITPDGKMMHLGKHYMERTDTGWSKVKSLGPLFKNFRIMRLMSSSIGTYYFDEATESGPIRYSRLIDGKHEKPKALNIALGKWNAHPFIAPDESYIMWDSEKDTGFGSNDLYISFRQGDGSWGSAINLGAKINTGAEEGGAYVTPDGKYLFFNRYINEENAGIYWVDAQIIKTLRPKL
ncbi:PD40 domain-containing protein [Pseudoalteromonas denitrificans]|uniref:WD40-like Beta Propeller Repeat n=1 Tax=Pseudoalteromonas denitrificans DSM 6059 TaxID=1123010 RepID=A0A1I1SCW2_9GAMM|nr:PD40 domain-containing protein [Pseudoalteromonas denitrificans]SFD42448.1 WD40-like Beta Propeller Repeat [Pseudoalteromonas denitrificans DSM 6059]